MASSSETRPAIATGRVAYRTSRAVARDLRATGFTRAAVLVCASSDIGTAGDTGAAPGASRVAGARGASVRFTRGAAPAAGAPGSASTAAHVCGTARALATRVSIATGAPAAVIRCTGVRAAASTARSRVASHATNAVTDGTVARRPSRRARRPAARLPGLRGSQCAAGPEPSARHPAHAPRVAAAAEVHLPGLRPALPRLADHTARVTSTRANSQTLKPLNPEPENRAASQD